jgi:hypothetical protein
MTKRQLGKSEGSKAVEDMLAGGLSFFTQQTGMVAFSVTKSYTHMKARPLLLPPDSIPNKLFYQ